MKLQQEFVTKSKHLLTHLSTTAGNINIFHSNDGKDARFTRARLGLHDKICNMSALPLNTVLQLNKIKKYSNYY